jgi:hypothetical protein
MSKENPGWGAPRIHGELLKLGINIGETSVSKYLLRTRRQPSQAWRAFLENHVKMLVSVDLALQKDTPEPRTVQPPEAGPIISVPEIGGLHHRYERRAA